MLNGVTTSPIPKPASSPTTEPLVDGERAAKVATLAGVVPGIAAGLVAGALRLDSVSNPNPLTTALKVGAIGALVAAQISIGADLASEFPDTIGGGLIVGAGVGAAVFAGNAAALRAIASPGTLKTEHAVRNLAGNALQAAAGGVMLGSMAGAIAGGSQSGGAA